MRSFFRDYLLNMAMYMLVFIVVYTIIRYKVIKRKEIKVRFSQEILLLIFWSYIVGVLSQTVIPIWHVYPDGNFYRIEVCRGISSVNFIPFRTIVSYLVENGKHITDWGYISIVNLCANIFLLFPFGLLLPMVFKSVQKGKRVIGFGMLFSIMIEILQILPGRSSDIDDVILNTLGCILGYLLYKLMVRNDRSRQKTTVHAKGVDC